MNKAGAFTKYHWLSNLIEIDFLLKFPFSENCQERVYIFRGSRRQTTRRRVKSDKLFSLMIKSKQNKPIDTHLYYSRIRKKQQQKLRSKHIYNFYRLKLERYVGAFSNFDII